ncbi:hypothetical protein [Listeria rocourtiae]|uniref:hypothetical protein n=1 Tax=Listeria rocourtiae TaxID=647910 RepID=UPI003D2F7B0C
MKKTVIIIIAIFALIGTGCSNKADLIESWKNTDSEVSNEEFAKLTQNNNTLEFVGEKIQVHNKDAVVIGKSGEVTNYFVQNAYIPIEQAKKIIKKDNWTKQDFLIQYIGAAQNVSINEKENTVEAFFITGAHGYGELRVTFEGDQLKSMTNTF